MTLESATYISELDNTSPPGSDYVKEGDDHLRLIKSVLGNTFPNADKPLYFPKVFSLSANHTAVAAEKSGLFRVSATIAAVTITLPPKADLEQGDWFAFVKTDNSLNAVLVEADTGNIEGNPTLVISLPHIFTILRWSGTTWDSDQRTAMPYQACRTITAATTLTHADNGKLLLVGNGTNDFTVTLPTLTNRPGTVFGFKHVGTAGGVITLNGTGAQQIEGNATFDLTSPGQLVWLTVFNNAWVIINSSYPAFTPDSENTWTENQFFDGASLIEEEQTLTYGASISWNLDNGNHAKVGLTGDAAFASATNKHIGQRGFLRLIGLADADLTWDSTYAWIGTPVTAVATDEIVILGYFVAASNLVYLWNENAGGSNLSVKAKVVFNGSTGAVIGTASNVASITHSSTGKWVINFAAALADANYGVVVTAHAIDSSHLATVMLTNGVAPSTTSVALTCVSSEIGASITTYNAILADSPRITVLVI